MNSTREMTKSMTAPSGVSHLTQLLPNDSDKQLNAQGAEFDSTIKISPTDLGLSTTAVLPTQLTTSSKSLADYRAEIEALLSDDVAKEFTNTVNHIIRLGGRKPKLLEARRAKLHDLVMRNKQIVSLYNAYATLQLGSEKRLTYRLPLFLELEPNEYGEMQLGEHGLMSRKVGDTALEAEKMSSMVYTDPSVPREKSLEQAPQAVDRANIQREGYTPQEDEPNMTRDAEQASITMRRINEIGGAVSCPTYGRVGQPRMHHHIENIPMPPVQAHLVGRVATSEFAEVEHKGSRPVRLDQEPPATVDTCRSVQSSPHRQNYDQNGISRRSIIVPVQNPEEFPTQRIQEVQSQYYPYTKIVAMWVHCDAKGTATQVTADVDSGSIDHVLINDARLISALGLREGHQDTISLDDSKFRADETFTINVLPDQQTKDPKAWIIGELVSARHAYLYWLDHRRSADPKVPPYTQEAKVLARQLGRRTPEVWREVRDMWALEQSGGGRRFREHRGKYLGENPSYPLGEERSPSVSMWV
ncbi:Nn.00g042940.m01.CDS01 [Neocucurbitaria sp. VM-36]